MSDLLDVRIDTDSAAHLASNSCDLQGCRRLILIDPEDREQVARLEHEFARRCGWMTGEESGKRTGFLQQALREFANPTPPRPEEPHGLGAVVANAKGHKFVRVADPIDGWAAGRQWQRIGGDVNAMRNFDWGQIDAVEVLSEGWSG